MSLQENIMRPSSILVAFLALFLVMPAQTPAVELTIHNAEQCGAKVALAYSRDGLQVVEGWHKLAPGQTRAIELFQVNAGDVYTSVVFEYPSIEQYMEKGSPLVEYSVQDVNFRYSERPEDLSALRKAVFHRIAPQEALSPRQTVRGSLGLLLKSTRPGT